MGERMSTFDALVEAAKKAPCLYEGKPDKQSCATRCVSHPECAMTAVLALVSSGGGTLTGTECEECKGRGFVLLPASEMSAQALDAGATEERKRCTACSGSGRQWQIGKLEGVYLDSPVSPQPIRWLNFVPRPDKEDSHAQD